MRTRHFVFGLGLLLLLSTSSALAQETASITGTVRDASGAVVSGAEVKVVSGGIGLSRVTTSNDAGDFLAAALPAGTYDLTVTAPGFKAFQAKGIVVRVAEKARVDVALQVGQISETITVEGTTVAQVETESSDVAGVVTGKEINQLELNGRDFTRLVALVPGVSNQTNRDAGQVGLNGNISYDINGGRAEYNNWQVDGANNMDTGSNDTLDVFPNVDAIAEFKVLTSNYSAVYGRNGSGNIEVVTKSGTKSFHGDVFEYARNEYFNANDYFDNAAGNPRPPYKKHDFGFTIGGPVILPGYNKNRDKTYFFYSQEWRRERNPFSFNQPVPSTGERGGNFSDQCPATNTPFTRVQNTTGPNFYPLCPGTATGSILGGQPSFNPIVTNGVLNQVPIDPNAAAMLSALISPPNTGSGLTSAFIESVSEPLTWRQELVRVDHNFSSRFRAMARYIHDTYSSVDPTVSFVGNPFPTIQTQIGTPGSSFVLHLTATASPTLLNEFIFSYSADHLILTNTGNFQVPSGFTMTSIFNTGKGGQRFAQLPAVSITSSGYGGGFTVNPGFMPWENANPTYGYRDTVSKSAGAHNLQFGAELIAIEKNEPNAPTGVGLGGTLGFNESNPLTTGNAFADFLQGNIATYSQTSAIVRYYYRYKILEPYFQDDWRVSKRLTLNLGLRVSLFQTNRDISKESFNFDPNVNTAGAAAAPAICTDVGVPSVLCTQEGMLVPGVGNPFLGFVQCGGSGGTSQVPGPILTAFPSASVAGTKLPGCQNGHYVNWGPRVGFAFDPRGDGKMAIRGGYGVFYEYGNGNEANAESLEGTPPKVLTASQPNILGYTSIGGTGGLTLFPSTVNNEPPAIIATQAKWPYVQQWHLDYQLEALRNTVATVSYVGSKGTHLTDGRDLNQLHALPASLNPYPQGQAISSGDCPASIGANGSINGNPIVPTNRVYPNLAVACGLDANPFRPFVGFGTLELLETEANSNYHALQASLRRSVGSLLLNVAYTYSHSIDNSSDRAETGNGNSFATLLDSYNLAGNKASSNFDQRHILNISYVYDLPFFTKSSGLKKSLLGGWQWSGITTIQTGIPFNVINPTNPDNAGTGNGVDGRTSNSRPDLVGDPNAAPCATAVSASPGPGPLLFNPCAFALPTGLTFGSTPRNLLYLPRRTNFDMGIFKHFTIKESKAIEFRWETFNTFNHTSFSRFHQSFGVAGSTFLLPRTAHDPRIMQFGLKFLF
jgi:hypothetical protein